MKLTSKKVIKNLLKRYRTFPSKGLGQNFLIDKRVIKKIIKEAQLQAKDIVLEIGPGIGTLTQEIAEKTKLVIAIEKDPKMVRILEEILKMEKYRNVKIIQDDILKINLKSYNLNLKSYRVVANLPFYLTAPLIRKFLETEFPPELMVLVVQKEVAQRICARPPKMNLLAVSVQFYAKAEIISYISKKSFWPQPKVDSAIIKIIPTKRGKVIRGSGKVDLFFRIVKAGFSQPRKQLANNLSKKLELNKEEIKSWLLKNNIQPNRRAETLTIKDWLNLTKSFKINI